MTGELRIHAAEPCSLANGPGKRAVVWVQGCSIRCPGCWNPETHDPKGGSSVEVDELVTNLAADGHDDRVLSLTVSGGEPLDQPEAVYELIQYWRSRMWERWRSYRSLAMDPDPPTVILFSGYSIFDDHWKSPSARKIWRGCDVVVAGPFTPTPREDKPGYEMGSCSTQITHNLTHVIKPRDLWTFPDAECIIHPDGKAVLTGTDPGLAEK